ncbi:unnamed protein product [Dimorphilus gyrociliatus]|uniref:Uncharacterized protein n=1 Tax=Dimorphilus gyrociliatus TaxID=2664684 RepID=A0A7I8VWT6_9ANNE|nr:unnamed protein product [Dimorphilus gyrociliatus]
MKIILFVSIVCLVSLVSSYDGLKVLNDIIVSMDRGLNFLNSQIGSLNLDSIIGTRIVEDQLRIAHENHPKSEYLVEILQKIEKLQRDASLISNKSIPYLKLQEPNYYWKMKDIIAPGSWLINKRHDDLLLVKKTQFVIGREEMDGSFSDYCISNLFRKNSNCRISKSCNKVMTSPFFNQYSLTHQVFFWLIFERAGCFLYDSSVFINYFTQHSCSRVFLEAREFEKEGYPKDGRDLFMEQTAICGLRGFRRNFCNANWLKEILKWQKSSGCWGESSSNKRDEKGLKGGCLAHQTAVALAALSQHLRFNLVQF